MSSQMSSKLHIKIQKVKIREDYFLRPTKCKTLWSVITSNKATEIMIV